MLTATVGDQFEQQQWQALTTWNGTDPSLAQAWDVISDADLPHAFREAVIASRHPFVKELRKSQQRGPQALARQKRWNNRFANLVSGRFTEILFSTAYGELIAKFGLNLTAKSSLRDWHDYLIEGDRGSFRIAINIKNAGVQFRKASQFVGMDPDDTLPIATYKIFGSSAREEQLSLVYVYLVDWTLIARLRKAYWSALNESERRLFQLITTFKGMPRDLEDCYIEATVGGRIEELSLSVGYDTGALDRLPFRAISGARCKAIFYRNHERSPYVFRQRMDTDPNVHVSVSKETVHFMEFANEWLASEKRRTDLSLGLVRTAWMAIPDPPV